MGPAGRDNRPYREYSRPTIEKMGDRHYLFASDVFDLTGGGKKLTEDELKEIPIRPTYTGEEFEYKTEEKEAFELLLGIISNGNKMQNEEFFSYPLGMLKILYRRISFTVHV